MADRAETSAAGFRRRTYDAVTALVGGTIGLFSPARAAFYCHGREVLRTYVAGELSGPNKNWRPRNKSADAEIKRAAKWLTARARDQVQNNGYISGAIDKICNNVVRKGIRPQACFKKAAGELDTALNDKVEGLWSRWARYADITGHDSVAALQRLILRHIWIDGEILIHRVWDNSLKGIVPLRLEVIECDMLDHRIDGPLTNGNIGRRGVEVDQATGRAVAFHVLESHPGDYLFMGLSGKSNRIDAADMIYVFDRRRASQTRGISWLAAIIMEAYDISEYKGIERVGAKLAAAFGIFVKSSYPDLPGAGIGIPGGNQSQPINTGVGWGDLPDYIDPGRIQKLPFGADIKIAEHNRPGTQYEPYIRDGVRGMSAGAGMSYESFSNDRSSSSYSSGRDGSLENRLSYGGQQFFLNEKVNNKLWAWFIEAAWMGGSLPELRNYAFDPLPYHEAVTWQNPGWTWVDPLKDSKAADQGISNVTTTRTKINANQGEDWSETLDEAIREEEKLGKLYEMRAKNQKMLEVSKNANA
ncbi:MAG: phage portal protein [Desulfobulbia bacterium]